MTSTIETHIQAVDATTLTPIALRATGCTEGELVQWTSEPIRPTSGNGGDSVIYRFSGTVWQQDETRPCSLPARSLLPQAWANSPTWRRASMNAIWPVYFRRERSPR